MNSMGQNGRITGGKKTDQNNWEIKFPKSKVIFETSMYLKLICI